MDFVTASMAAEEKRCSRQNVYQALDAGRLTEKRVGETRLIVVDEKYEQFTPRPYGDKRQADES